MEIKVVKSINNEVVTDIICDCCGKSCKVDEFKIDNELRPDNGETHYDFEFMSLQAHWGYNSNKDTESWTAHICEKCVDEKFGFIKFKKDYYRPF
jgi:hypothetical protein